VFWASTCEWCLKTSNNDHVPQYITVHNTSFIGKLVDFELTNYASWNCSTNFELVAWLSPFDVESAVSHISAKQRCKHQSVSFKHATDLKCFWVVDTRLPSMNKIVADFPNISRFVLPPLNVTFSMSWPLHDEHICTNCYASHAGYVTNHTAFGSCQPGKLYW